MLGFQPYETFQLLIETGGIDRTNTLEEAQKVVVDTKPDLFVLDVDAATDLTQDFLYDLRTSHPNARAIILTAVHLAAARERTAGLGAIHLLEKPFPHGDFVDLVQALLQPEQSADAEFRVHRATQFGRANRKSARSH